MSTTTTSPIFVGIDVSKSSLDLFVRPLSLHWSVDYLPENLPQLVSRLKALAPSLIVLEATGGLQSLVATHLASAQLPVVVVNPRQTRDFARAVGELAKTD